jgi:hypothetical protein
MTLIFETLCILAAALSLVAGYIQFGLPQAAVACLVTAVLWLIELFSHWPRLKWVPSAGLLVFILMAGLGAWVGLSLFLPAVSVLFSLWAWDLSDFSRRLRRAAPQDDLRGLEKAHFLRLGVLGGISLALMLTALLVHLQISFGWLFLLALFAILGLLQLVKRVRMGG